MKPKTCFTDLPNEIRLHIIDLTLSEKSMAELKDRDEKKVNLTIWSWQLARVSKNFLGLTIQVLHKRLASKNELVKVSRPKTLEILNATKDITVIHNTPVTRDFIRRTLLNPTIMEIKRSLRGEELPPRVEELPEGLMDELEREYEEAEATCQVITTFHVARKQRSRIQDVLWAMEEVAATLT